MNPFQTFSSILAFYAILSYIVFPLGFYYFIERSLISAGNGFVLGSIISIMLWFGFGRKIVHSTK